MAKRQIGPDSLGIDIKSGKEREIFKWFLASFLFGKRISQEIAARTYRVFVDQHHVDSPKKICARSWQQLVDMLGEGHYVRYDESTASRLLELCHRLENDYGGRITKLLEDADSESDRRDRLLAFKGVGPKTAQIFLRELA